MRILYHHRTLADGAEGIHIAAMVFAFRELGHEVHVRGLAGSGDAAVRSGLVRRLKSALPAAAFEAASVGSNVPDYLNVRGAIRAIRPDFMYKRHARYDVGALYAARRAGIPVVLEVNCLFAGRQYHSFEPMALEPLAARLERRSLELSAFVVAVSTPLSREIQTAAGVHAVVIPNGVDSERFDPARVSAASVRKRYDLGSDLTIGWAGVIRPWHGLELLLEAAARIPQVRLLIVGDGPARVDVERRAAALGVSTRMTITGRVAHDSMPDHLAAMDVAVVASDGTGVASPMKLLEYMAMSRAVVAPRTENIQDVVTDEANGLLFAPDDPVDLTKVLCRLVGDGRLRETLGRAARRYVQESRSWLGNAKRVLALIPRPSPDSTTRETSLREHHA